MALVLRLGLLIALACSPLFAQTPACTQITDVLYAPGVSAPVTMTGTIDVSLGYSAPDGSFTVTQGPARQTVVAGVVSSCLAPGSYSAFYTARKPAPLSGNTTFTRYWIVPSTGGPYTVQAIESQTVATPVLQIAWAQLPAPPSTGTYCVESTAGAIAWGSCGSSALSWSHLTSGQWSSLTSAQWSALTP